MEPPQRDPEPAAPRPESAPAPRPGARRAPPGEVVPPAHRILDHAPSDRYASASATPTAHEPLTGSAARAAVGAILPAAIGTTILVVLASPLALVEPLVVVAVLLGLAAGLGARWGGGSATPRSRRRLIGVGVAVVGVAVAEFIVWRLALAEGGVLAVVDYELQVFGPIAVLQPLSAALAAWATA